MPGFEWTLELVSRTLARTLAEGSHCGAPAPGSRFLMLWELWYYEGLPIGPIVVPFWGAYLESYEV